MNSTVVSHSDSDSKSSTIILFLSLSVLSSCIYKIILSKFFKTNIQLPFTVVVFMGLYMSKYKYCISSNVQPAMASTWRIATHFINILIFTITGIILARLFIDTATDISAKDFGFSVVLYIMIHVGRLVTVIILYPLMMCSRVHLSWKGLRGSMSIILVLIVSLDTELETITHHRFLFHISMIVLLTLIINGTSSKYSVKILGLHHDAKGSEIVLLQAFEHKGKFCSTDDHQHDKNIRLQFPELGNLNERIMDEICDGVKTYQINAMYILLVLKQSYRLCWIVQMTRRCAQMLLKYESIAIIQFNLLERNQRVTNAYLIIRDLVQHKNGTSTTYYKCGNIIGADTFFNNKSSSNGTYYANCELVETFVIDAAVLHSLLSDGKISRSIYNEIAAHVITNNYRSLVHLTRPQLKAFLNEKAIFYKKQSKLPIELQPMINEQNIDQWI
ncbi:unnamed protein product [Adineta ricciae]|uniref:Cation/H+ exchanger transmembrane domain-containing protein n=1 Tax=Adineta ricciae TaxID=249248 RepID=A0A814QEB6_ADIRI|nr:unnamed protein product [Adineta ricciae]